jgi:hypothetical protein
MPTRGLGLEVFISHSSQDQELAEALILLLRSALSLSAEGIRCSSVDGYRLPVGSNTDDKIRQEVYQCNVLIGLLTPASIASPYVLFELGARWGAGLDIAPVVCRGADIAMLRGPLKSLNCLDGSVEAQVHQLLFDVARILDRHTASPAAYVKQLEQFVKEARFQGKLPAEVRQRVTTPLRLRNAFLVGCGLGNRIGLIPLGEGQYNLIPLGEGQYNEFAEFVDALDRLRVSGPASDGLRRLIGDKSLLLAAATLPVDSDPAMAAEELERNYANRQAVAELLKLFAKLMDNVGDEVAAELSNFELAYYKLGQLLYGLAIKRLTDENFPHAEDGPYNDGELIALSSLIEMMAVPSFLRRRLSSFVNLASDPAVEGGARLLEEANSIAVALYNLLDVLASIPPPDESATTDRAR